MAGKTHFSRGEANLWVESLYRPNEPKGNVYYVCNAIAAGEDSTSAGFSPEKPFDSIAYAVGVATVDNDDVILVLPGHVETITGAAGVAMARAGVTVRGVGVGRQRPKVNFTTAIGASWNVTAARCVIENLWFLNSFDAQTAMLNVSAADCHFRDCEFVIGDGSTQAILGILTTASADRLVIERCHFHGGSTAGVTAAISLVGGDSIVIADCEFFGAFDQTTGVVKNATTDSTNLRVLRNRIQNSTASNTKSIVLTASTTGIIAGNRLQILSGSAPITGAAMAMMDNVYSNTIATDPELSYGLQAIGDALYGTAGIASFPSGAVAGNAVSLAEVIRYVQENVANGGTVLPAGDSLFGILAGGSGITTWPAAAAAGNGVSIAEALRYLDDAVQGSAGVVTFPAAAAPANGVSLAEVLRAIYDRQLGDGTSAATNSRLGKKVTRAAADIFDGTQKALFTIGTGKVLLTGIYLEVSDFALDASASNLKFRSNPTIGSDADLSANLDVNADEIGSLYSLTGTAADATTGGSGGGAVTMDRPVILDVGTLDIVTSADVGTGGALVAATLWYIPLEDGATVVAA